MVIVKQNMALEFRNVVNIQPALAINGIIIICVNSR